MELSNSPVRVSARTQKSSSSQHGSVTPVRVSASTVRRKSTDTSSKPLSGLGQIKPGKTA